jgi:hypothetical protein
MSDRLLEEALRCFGGRDRAGGSLEVLKRVFEAFYTTKGSREPVSDFGSA